MKTAIFFSGRITTYEDSVYWLKPLIDKYNADCFCSLNSNSIDAFIKLFNIKKYYLEEFELNEQEEDLYKKSIFPALIYITNVKNVASMFYNHYKNMELIDQYQIENNIKYDMILYLRSDILPEYHLDIQFKLEKNTVYIPLDNDWGGVNDQMAFGDYESMKKYTSLYQHLNNYIKNKVVNYHPETMLNYHLKNMDLNIVRIYYPYKLNKQRKD
jgi:hypothetical protein